MVRFGILGCGRIVVRGLIPGIQGSERATLHAVASRRPGVAAEFAAKYGAHRSYRSYEALLADPEIDAVYIPTAGDEHHRWTLAAARAGKHVLCEKPLATSVREAEEMVAACREAGVILQEAFMWRHHPRTKRAQELLDAGAIGELRLICASFSFDIDRNDWRLDPKRGGGALWDVGCYGVNAARLFTGTEPAELYARAHLYSTGVDMTTQAALRFPGDVLANIDCSFETPFRCRLELVGTTGRMELPETFLPAERAELLLFKGPETAPPERILLPAANQYIEQVNDFCASIAAGTLQPPAEDGLDNMRVLESLYASLAARRG